MNTPVLVLSVLMRVYVLREMAQQSVHFPNRSAAPPERSILAGAELSMSMGSPGHLIWDRKKGTFLAIVESIPSSGRVTPWNNIWRRNNAMINSRNVLSDSYIAFGVDCNRKNILMKEFFPTRMKNPKKNKASPIYIIFLGIP
ncbi:MAG: hypothetical protein HXS47_13285 [Theionarchaea archaeon]|nr:hypothetical protein [Theionarchaea archaeon]